MYDFREDFLKRSRLDDAPQKVQDVAVNFAQVELGLYIDEAMRRKLNDAQMQFFEELGRGEQAAVDAVLVDDSYLEDGRYLDAYAALMEGGLDEDAAIAEATAGYALMRWLEQNFPEYEAETRNAINNIAAMCLEHHSDILINFAED